MTQKEKRIKIATYLHWTNIKEDGGFLIPRHLAGCIPGDSQRLPVPNYPEDLNAMHEAEFVLTGDQWDKYCENLGGSLFACASASCTTRFEAFGITLNLWQPGE